MGLRTLGKSINLEAGEGVTNFIGFGLINSVSVLFLDSLETRLEIRESVQMFVVS